MSKTQLHKIISYLIAAIWLINGLFCKVLNLVPRHEQIVSRILGDDHSRILTILIGLSEIGMSVWIVIGFKKRLNSLLQIIIVAIMNILEFILVPDLLLWGKFNSVFAFILILVIYYNEFFLNPKSLKK